MQNDYRSCIPHLEFWGVISIFSKKSFTLTRPTIADFMIAIASKHVFFSPVIALNEWVFMLMRTLISKLSNLNFSPYCQQAWSSLAWRWYYQTNGKYPICILYVWCIQLWENIRNALSDFNITGDTWFPGTLQWIDSARSLMQNLSSARHEYIGFRDSRYSL